MGRGYIYHTPFHFLYQAAKIGPDGEMKGGKF